MSADEEEQDPFAEYYCAFEDSALEMAAKIQRFHQVAAQKVVVAISKEAAARNSPLPTNGIVFAAKVSALGAVVRQAQPEYTIPRDFIRPDETELAHLRDLMEASIVLHDPAVLNKAEYRHPRLSPKEKVPPFYALMQQRSQLISDEDFKQRAATCESYQALHAAFGLMEQTLAECREVAGRKCKRCPTFGARHQCAKTKEFYCCSVCVDNHIDNEDCSKEHHRHDW